MNISKLANEVVSLSLEKDVRPDRLPELREKEAKLIKIIDALQKIQATKEWSSLKTEVFDDLPKRFKSELLSEAKKDNPDVLKLRFISGELMWAERNSNLTKLEETYRVELQNLRLMLYGKHE